MVENERREPSLENFYEVFNIPYLASDTRIRGILNNLKEEAKNNKDEMAYRYIQLAEEYLLERRELYDKYLKRHGVKFPNTKKEKKLSLVKKTIAAGLIVAIGLGTTAVIQNEK